MKPLWLHIGLAKTATTTFQRMLFSRHPQIGYLGKNWIEDEKAKAALMQLARGPERKLDLHEVATAFGRLRARYETDSNVRACLLSEEDLTTFRFVDATACARRAKMIFPEARVILIIREPIEWLRSMYFFRLSLRFPETLHGFNSWLKQGLECRFRATDMGQVQVGLLVDVYAQCFGAGNMTVLRYEDFAADSTGFISALAKLVGIDETAALALLHEKGDRAIRKLRVTEAQKDFLEKYRLVMQGRYREYLEELAPLLASLPKKARREAEGLLQIDLDGDRDVVQSRFRALSAFLDRSCRPQLELGPRATAEIDPELKRQVMEIWEPGARVIAARFNPRANNYFEPAGAQ